MLAHTPCGDAITNGRNHASTATRNTPTHSSARRRLSLRHDVDQRDREDHDRERLRGEAEPEERKPGPGAAEPDRGDRRDRQQRRPQVVPREDHRSHQHGHQRAERDARDQPAKLRALVDQNGTPRGPTAAIPHASIISSEDVGVGGERRAGEQPGEQEHRQRQRRVDLGEVPVGDQPALHHPRVVRVDRGVEHLPDGEAPVVDDDPRDHEPADRGQHCDPRPVTRVATLASGCGQPSSHPRAEDSREEF